MAGSTTGCSIAGPKADAEVLDEVHATTGAIVMGKRMFDGGVEPLGHPPPFPKPVFLIIHEPREPLPKQGGSTDIFASDGIEAAVERARAAAGDKNVGIWAAPTSSSSTRRPGCWTSCKFT